MEGFIYIRFRIFIPKNFMEEFVNIKLTINDTKDKLVDEVLEFHLDVKEDE